MADRLILVGAEAPRELGAACVLGAVPRHPPALAGILERGDRVTLAAAGRGARVALAWLREAPGQIDAVCLINPELGADLEPWLALAAEAREGACGLFCYAGTRGARGKLSLLAEALVSHGAVLPEPPALAGWWRGWQPGPLEEWISSAGGCFTELPALEVEQNGAFLTLFAPEQPAAEAFGRLVALPRFAPLLAAWGARGAGRRFGRSAPKLLADPEATGRELGRALVVSAGHARAFSEAVREGAGAVDALAELGAAGRRLLGALRGL